MLYFLPVPIKGILSFLLYAANTIIMCSLLFVVAAFKLLLPMKSARLVCDRILIFISTCWISFNSINSDLFSRIDWDIRGAEKLKKKEWYLVLSNHQSWVDILALQKTLNRKIPMLKFFLKKELIWVPFLGLAWWALDFPFMKRYSKELLKAKPHLKGKDLERTRKACLKFKTTPVSVMNFIEGTRFTEKKHQSNKIPFQHLLEPKAGGIAFVLGAMGETLHKIINVTIVYQGKTPSFWQYISGRVHKITIDFEIIPITKDLMGDYFNDAAFKEKFCTWLNTLWHHKDMKINAIKNE